MPRAGALPGLAAMVISGQRADGPVAGSGGSGALPYAVAVEATWQARALFHPCSDNCRDGVLILPNIVTLTRQIVENLRSEYTEQYALTRLVAVWPASIGWSGLSLRAPNKTG